jgi:poly(A) polymerase
MAGVKISDPPWAYRAGFAALLGALDADQGTTRVVGGAVRDTLAGLPVKDIDLATTLQPEEVITRLKAARIKPVPTGLAHGTVTAVLSSGPIEITTLREDVATDGRRATIAYTHEWQADAARRDFTINALYADPLSGIVHDYFGGLVDLEAGRVRFIGEPLQRIAEDHLRILRFFRFQARFGSAAPDAEALAACKARANDLMALSRERIAMELLAILDLPDPAAIIALMIETGIFVPVLPEINEAALLAELVVQEREQGVAPDRLRRLAAVLPADGAQADAMAARLKLSNAQRKRLMLAASRDPADAGDPHALAYWHGIESAVDRLLLGGVDVRGILGWTPPQFPLSGGAIVARGIKAGPDVARLLNQIERQWVAEGFPDASRIDAILSAVIAQRD